MAHTDPGSVTDAVQAMEIARCVLQACGHLFAFVKQASFSDGSFRAIIEYCNPDSALKALKNCDGLSVEASRQWFRDEISSLKNHRVST